MIRRAYKSRQPVHVAPQAAPQSFSDTRRMTVQDDEFLAVSEGRIRIRIGVVAFLFMLGIVLLRLAEIALLSPQDHRKFLPQAITKVRADMTDRNGELLATTLTTYSLYAEPRRVWNPRETAQSLAAIRPNLNVRELEAKLDTDRAFVWLERGLTPKERQAVFELGMPGLDFRSEPKRVYPRGQLASHYIGFTDVDMIGVAGSERAFEDRLKGDNAPDVALALDMRVQFAVADELQKSVDKFSADSGAAVVMDIKSGELIALVSVPNFDPNNPGATSPETRFNHASMSTYDLGSVFKPLTMAMALEDGVANQTELFPVQKPYRVLNKYIRDDHPSDVPLNMAGVLAESSNRGTAMLAQRIGADSQKAHLRNLGLLDRVPVELAESARPQVQRRWGEMATVTVSYGHGLAVSPLSLTAAIGALLNDGLYVAPTVLRRDALNPVETKRVFRQETSDALRHMMRQVVTEGTGRKANIPGFGVMGKTGTAEKPANGGYDQKRLVTSFVAAFPHSDPRYAMIVTLDEPQAIEGTYGYATAGWNAAPTAGQVIARIGPMLPGARDIVETANVIDSETGRLQREALR
ncbi:peptidoglycan D,D-transpeptidase FtsI family protein [Litorimonas sp. RW-G-Af-16]|uniref:peptidoglycan D,D-transpeptidase FtsI family protein n=1 Tax=Litorimonas sp. RW-G-Af-16 TaxID=3241168 RepID=UPI00390C63C8